jgi:hypothetical protein
MPICSMCRQEKKKIDTHHLIPRSWGGTDKDTIQVCSSCHRKAESKFNQIVLYGGAPRVRDSKTMQIVDLKKFRKYRKSIKSRTLYYSKIHEEGIAYVTEIICQYVTINNHISILTRKQWPTSYKMKK